MADSGNSGFGYRPAPPATVQAAEAEPGAAACERCGHEGMCSCPSILASSIAMWTGADYDAAGRIAAEVWANTHSFRLGDTVTDYTPVRRDCTFCGSAVHKSADGRLPPDTLVSTTISSGADPVEEPICPDSPTQRHALP